MRDPSTHWLTLQMPPAARIQPGLGQARAGAGTQPRSALRRARTQLWKAPDSQGASTRSGSRADGAGAPALSCVLGGQEAACLPLSAARPITSSLKP